MIVSLICFGLVSNLYAILGYKCFIGRYWSYGCGSTDGSCSGPCLYFVFNAAVGECHPVDDILSDCEEVPLTPPVGGRLYDGNCGWNNPQYPGACLCVPYPPGYNCTADYTCQ